LLSSWSGAEECPTEPGSELESIENSDFAAFLGYANELGYSLAWASLDAQYAGLAQRRERLFVVGYLGDDWRPSAAVLLESEGMCGDYPTRREKRKDVAATLNARTKGGGGLGTDFELDGGQTAVCDQVPSHDIAQTLLAKANSSHRADAESYVAIPSTGNVAHCLNAGGMGRQDYETETLVTHALRADGFDASEDGTGRGTPLVPIAFAHQQGGSRDIHVSQGVALAIQRSQGQAIAFTSKDYGADAEEELSPTLRAGGHDKSHANAGVMPAVSIHQNADGEVREGEVAYTLNTNSSASGRNTGMVHAGAAVRRLTPMECERLQGFPDRYTDVLYRGKPAADGPRYKALGNSQAVPVMRLILKRIEYVDSLISARRAA
jgi:DNA (cytosine-5)-methyltransferase 1